MKHEPERKTRLMKAIEDNDYGEAVRLIRDTGMKPDDFNNYPFIHVAIKNKQVPVIDALIKAGANLNQFHNNQTPIYIASMNDDEVEIVSMLIAGGADVNLGEKGSFGSTARSPLWVATVYDYAETIKVLLAAGADIENAYEQGWTALLTAAYRNKNKALRVLLDAGAKVNIKTKEGFTPIYAAAQEGNLEGVQMLIAAGANINETVRGYTALDAARKEQRYYTKPDSEQRALYTKMVDALRAAGGLDKFSKETPASGGRKRTRKHHSKKRNTRRK